MNEMACIRSGRAFVYLLPLLAAFACGDPEAQPADPSSRFHARSAEVAVTGQGTAATLDVANWNLEWFGDTGNAPTNDALQQANVRDAILGTDFDVWGLVEVVSAFSTLKAALPGYDGVLSNDPVVTSGSAYYTASEQKVALLWKTSVASLVSARLILTANDYDFGGRPPMEVTLRVTLNGTTEDRVFIVLHAKAMSDTTSWQRRLNASTALKAYLDATWPTQKVTVLGDLNDDIDTSITAGKASPYQNFVSDVARYTFATLPLSQGGIASTCNYTDTIDHQLLTNELAQDLVAGSVQVYRLDGQISGYCTNTSDHYPVLARYVFGSGSPPPPPPPPQEALAVTSPNGGESWTVGSAHAITWTAASVTSVAIDYTLDDGASWVNLAASVAASAGTWSWTLPSTASALARVRVRDAADGAPVDASDAVFAITAAPPPPAKVILNEILANEPGSATAGEFVELVNVGGTAIDISGWKLWDASAARHTFAAGTVLNPGKAIVVFGAASGIPAGTPSAVASSTGALSLGNSGDTVSVRNTAGAIIDSYTYAAALAGTDGVSMNRSPDLTAGAVFTLHTALSSLKASPGKSPAGVAY